MTALLIFIVILLIAVIIFIEIFSPAKTMTKKSYLTGLSRYLGGHLEKLETSGESYRITFEMDGVPFVFEDMEERGINKIIDNINLRMKVDVKMNLFFLEKKQRTSIRTDLVMASQIPNDVVPFDDKVVLPKSLQMFEIYTNQPALANRIFQNSEAVSFLTEIKNVDQRGYPFIHFKIADGFVSLSFYKEAMFRPNIVEFSKDPASIERYIDKLMVFNQIVKNQY